MNICQLSCNIFDGTDFLLSEPGLDGRRRPSTDGPLVDSPSMEALSEPTKLKKYSKHSNTIKYPPCNETLLKSFLFESR